MKTTDLIFENQKVLNAMQNLVLQSKKHIEFLAANAPEIRTNLESVAESMQTLADMMEIKSCLTMIHASSLRKSAPAKIKHTTLSPLKNLSGVSKPFANVTPQTCTSI
jgi:hypothetical protein